jgi:hypothetical protein
LGDDCTAFFSVEVSSFGNSSNAISISLTR